jgi:predicted phage-related endonuclease
MTVYAEKIGAGTPDEDNAYLKWGRWLQPLLLQWLIDDAGVKAIGREIFIVSEADPIFTATLDGFIEEGDSLIPVEVKNTAWKEYDWENGIPAYVMVQVQHQIYVAGAEHAYVVAAIGGQPPIWKLVDRNPEMIEEIVSAGRSFWANHVEKGNPPPADADPKTSKALGRIYPGGDSSMIDFTGDLADMLPELTEKMEGAKALKENVDEIKNMLKRAIGNADGGIFPGGEKVTWRPDKNGKRSFRGPK